MKILRYVTDDGMRMDFAVVADFRPTADVGMGVYLYAFPQANRSFNNCVRADVRRLGYVCLLIDDGCRMNGHLQ